MNQRGLRSKYGVVVGVLLAGYLAGTGYGQAPAGQKPATPTPSPAASSPAASPDKVVLKVGDEQITQGDLDFVISSLNPQSQKAVATQGRRPLGEQFTMMLLLSQQAVSHHLDASPSYVRQLAVQRHQLLARAAYDELARQVTVSPEETSKYYSDHPSEYEETQIRQVVVRKRTEGAKEGTPGLPPVEARTRADAIKKALAGATDVKQLAEKFQMPNEIIIDVEPRTMRRGAMRPEMEKAVLQLKEGEISEVFDLPEAAVLFQLVSRRRQELKEVSAQIEGSIRQQKTEALLADLKKKTTVWMDEEYFAPPAAPAPGAKMNPPAPTPGAKMNQPAPTPGAKTNQPAGNPPPPAQR